MENYPFYHWNRLSARRFSKDKIVCIIGASKGTSRISFSGQTTIKVTGNRKGSGFQSFESDIGGWIDADRRFVTTTEDSITRTDSIYGIDVILKENKKFGILDEYRMD